MKDLTKYQGIFPAFYACYDQDGKVSPQTVRDLARYFLDKGVKGLYVGGSSGECIYQSVAAAELTGDEEEGLPPSIAGYGSTREMA